MKLGLQTGYWGAGPPPGVEEQISTAEELGFESLWTAEAYGSDAISPLAWYGSRTDRIKLGTSIMQLSARTPTAAAMAAMTMDHLSGGRFILGLGASGPQVVEGWYGQPYPRPLARTREYVEIIRQVLAREAPVTFDGDFYQLPYPGGKNLGKPLKPTVHPLRKDIPIFLGAEGPKNIALSAEIADGWLPLFFAPKDDAWYRAALQEGFDRPGSLRGLDDFARPATVTVVIGDDVEACADFCRPFIALYVGGMGARGENYHFDVFSRMGYEGDCVKIQELYLAGNKDDAYAAVPTQMVEDMSLVGSPDKIRDDLEAWRESVVTELIVSGDPAQLRQIAEIVWG